jgi:hypothetical protein
MGLKTAPRKTKSNFANNIKNGKPPRNQIPDG